MLLMKRCLTILSLFDLHSDIPSAVYDDIPSAVSFPEDFERQIQTAAVFVPEVVRNPYTYYHNMLRQFMWTNTLPVNQPSAKQTLLLSLEGGSVFERDLKRLYGIKRDGISSVSLTWNSDNSLAGGAHGSCGLSLKGASAIKIMNELGLALDISHLNDKSATNALHRADTVLASHSNCRAVHRHPRNLPDEILTAIRDKGGIVGINFYPAFLPDCDIFEGIYRNIRHMLLLGMRNCIAIGSDFDGADMNENLKCTEDIAVLYDFLYERFEDKTLLDDIFFGNAYTFYKKLFDKQSIM